MLKAENQYKNCVSLVAKHGSQSPSSFKLLTTSYIQRGQARTETNGKDNEVSLTRESRDGRATIYFVKSQKYPSNLSGLIPKFPNQLAKMCKTEPDASLYFPGSLNFIMHEARAEHLLREDVTHAKSRLC